MDLLGFYAANTGIPGAVPRPAPPRAAPVVASVRDAFDRTQYLAYADPELRAMRGAEVMRGPELQQYNAYNLPSHYFTGPAARRENCSCNKKYT